MVISAYQGLLAFRNGNQVVPDELPAPALEQRMVEGLCGKVLDLVGERSGKEWSGEVRLSVVISDELPARSGRRGRGSPWAGRRGGDGRGVGEMGGAGPERGCGERGGGACKSVSSSMSQA